MNFPHGPCSLRGSKQGHQTGCTASEQSFYRKRSDGPDIRIKLHSVICEDSVPSGLICCSSGIYLSKLNWFIPSRCILKWQSYFNALLYSNIAGDCKSVQMLSIRVESFYMYRSNQTQHFHTKICMFPEISKVSSFHSMFFSPLCLSGRFFNIGTIKRLGL